MVTSSLILHWLLILTGICSVVSVEVPCQVFVVQTMSGHSPAAVSHVHRRCCDTHVMKSFLTTQAYHKTSQILDLFKAASGQTTNLAR